jgi:hypothetical protein
MSKMSCESEEERVDGEEIRAVERSRTKGEREQSTYVVTWCILRGAAGHPASTPQ